MCVNICPLSEWFSLVFRISYVNYEISKALFGSLERMGRESLKKKRKKEWRALGGESLVLFMIQNPPNLGELKNCIGRGFWGFG